MQYPLEKLWPRIICWDSWSQTKEGEFESLLVDLEGDITISSVRDKCTISSPNLYTTWEHFHFVFRVQAVVAVIGYDASASTRIP